MTQNTFFQMKRTLQWYARCWDILVGPAYGGKLNALEAFQHTSWPEDLETDLLAFVEGFAAPIQHKLNWQLSGRPPGYWEPSPMVERDKFVLQPDDTFVVEALVGRVLQIRARFHLNEGNPAFIIHNRSTEQVIATWGPSEILGVNTPILEAMPKILPEYQWILGPIVEQIYSAAATTLFWTQLIKI